MAQLHRSGRLARAGLVVLGVTVTTAVVALAGRAPMSGSPVNAASAHAPLTALGLFFAGAGLLALLALVIAIWRGRRHQGDEEPEMLAEAVPVRRIWKVLTTLLALALPASLIAAAVLGLRNRRPSSTLIPVGLPGAGPVAPLHASSRGAPSTFVLPGWLPWTAVAIVLLAVVAFGIWLALRLRAQREPVHESNVGAATQAAVEAAIGALEGPADPRSAVIAAYAAMERTLAEHGVARPRSEAPREYLMRVLTHASESEPEARRLTSLFEEARFSPHPIPERVRELALATLDSLRRHFDRVAA